MWLGVAGDEASSRKGSVLEAGPLCSWMGAAELPGYPDPWLAAQHHLEWSRRPGCRCRLWLELGLV